MFSQSQTRLAVVSALLIFATACASTKQKTAKAPKKLDIKVAIQELDAIGPGNYPAYTAIGSLSIKSAKDGGRSTILLAGEGDRYRLQIMGLTGQVSYAVAGKTDHRLTLNLNTGKVEVVAGEEAKNINWRGASIPSVLIHTLITGAPPDTARIASATTREGMREVITKDPDLTIFYSERLESIRFISKRKETVIEIGPMKDGAQARYVSSVVILFGKKWRAEITWNKVSHGVSFPDGYFTFDDKPFE